MLSDEHKATNFFETVNLDEVMSMFDLMPGVMFWVKNCNGQIIHANQAFLHHNGIATLHDAIGQTDLAFSSEHIARQFINDDKKVLKGEHVTERLEVNQSENGEIYWFITSKRPLYASTGQIIGTYGTSKKISDKTCSLPEIQALRLPVDYIRQHFSQTIRMADLAKISHLSVSALERRFKKHLHMTPLQFINQVRLENARKMLIETDHSVYQIALSVGFSDHSYFSRQFYNYFHELPSDVKNLLRKTR
ncbi:MULTISPECIES: AraC family transcriptional regulator [Pseudoalteromonas]|uniref:AraC family transcriptional regulator n=1 Tax=Pseudoalteromonas amylolytica TaxID=1859457 RepID=A0A1S1N041_9GAMM|nr:MULTISPECIES: AraC family transcriptional regulator [Pseudoalteromonas]OHU90561.1 AraC family transcriptional regulator [Pseudoalteromonas sp. JW3]OHU92817.1 AraC family transcriptional regulator [Pseudoalteromonas amylolytica]